MSAIDIKTVVNSIKVHVARGLENPELTRRIQNDFPDISFEDYNRAARTAVADIEANTSNVDIKIIVKSIKAYFALGLKNNELADQIRHDFQGIRYEQYDRAANAAWDELIADGELQIKYAADAEHPKFSVWFISGTFSCCEVECDAHWEAAFQAHVLNQGRYRGVAVTDKVAQ